MNRFQTTPGLVINRRSRLNCQLVTLLTPQLGKIEVLLKHGRRWSKLQLGNIVKAQIYHKDGFFWLSEVETNSSFLTSTKSLSQLNLLFYFLEITNRLVASNQHTDYLYQLAIQAINAIQTNDFKSFILTEMSLLKILGFGLPSSITASFNNSQFQDCQKQLHRCFESLIEQPLESPRLFR